MDECVKVVLFVIASGCGFLNMLRAKVTSRFRFLKKYTEPVCFVKEFVLQDRYISWLFGIVRNHCYGLNPVGFFFLLRTVGRGFIVLFVPDPNPPVVWKE